MARCHHVIGDDGSIKIAHNPGHDTFDLEFTARLHTDSVTWLEAALSGSLDGPTVAVTHDAPSPRCLAPGAIIDPISAAYASDLEPMIRRHEPKLWVSRHVQEVAVLVDPAHGTAKQSMLLGGLAGGNTPAHVVIKDTPGDV